MEAWEIPEQPKEWAELWEAMKGEPSPWVLTTDRQYWAMLEVLPPEAMHGTGFLVGEATRHNANGEAVYAMFCRVGDEYQARYMTLNEFREWASIRSAT